MKHQHGILSSYGFATLAYTASALLTLTLWDRWLEQLPFAAFFVAVALTAWWSGLRPALIVAGAGAVTVGLLMAGSAGVKVGAPVVLFGVSATVAVLMDLRRRAQSAVEDLNAGLASERGRLDAVLQHIPAGVLLATGPDGRLVIANQAAADLPHHSSRGTHMLDEFARDQALHSDGRPYEPEEYPLVRSLQTGVVIRNEEIDHLCGDGVRRVFAVSSAPIRDTDQRITSALAVFHDVTERRILQSQVLQSQRLESIGRLAGGVAHDFNNLLTAIMGYSNLLLQDTALPDQQRGKLEEIARCGHRASDLTRQLLAFSRQQVLQPTVLDLGAVVRALGKMLERLIREPIQLVIRNSPQVGRVKADAGQVKRVIFNLTVNAKDAIPHGGTLTLEAADVELDTRYAREHADVQPGPYVMLGISDTCVGMSRDVQPRVFEPCVTTKAPGSGTGLGLATVYGIVKQTGGHIWVYSEPGRGSTFKVYFPRVNEEVAATSRVPSETRALGGSEAVLLVEDDQAVRQLVRAVLTSAGYTVMKCQNAKRGAVDVRQLRRPDSAVVDRRRAAGDERA